MSRSPVRIVSNPRQYVSLLATISAAASFHRNAVQGRIIKTLARREAKAVLA